MKKRSENQDLFLSLIDKARYRTDFKLEGSSNYAFNLILKDPDDALMKRLMTKLDEGSVEYRRGSAGGGNQLRQPYLKGIATNEGFPNVDHVHFYGVYIGNFPDLTAKKLSRSARS